MKIKTNISLAMAIGGFAFTASSASAAVTYGTGVTGTTAEVFSTSVGTYSGDVSNSDILTGVTPTFTESDWLNGRNPNQLNDGLHGADGDATSLTQAATPPKTAIFDLGTGTNGLGYDLSSIVSIAAWGGVEFGQQIWTLEVKGVELTDTYSTLLSVDYQPATANATKVTVTDLAGGLASGVQFIRVTQQPNPGGGSNRWTWRELDIEGTSTAVPEPSTTALLGLGGLALILRRRK